MTEIAESPAGHTERVEQQHKLDRRRVVTFIGLVLGRLGPRARGAVSGVFLALLVGQRTSSLFLVSFALTAHRWFSWLTYPLIGRWSDRSDTRVGKRTPYMGAGLLVLSACTFALVHTSSYWMLVALIVIGRQAAVLYNLPSAVQTPEIFGGSRWIRAIIAVGAGGILVGLSIRLTVIATWKRDDPSTWAPAFELAAVYILIAGLAVLFLVREAPAARTVRIKRAQGSWGDRVREVLAVPNGKVLITALMVSIAGGGFTDRAYPIYASKVLRAGGGNLAVAGLVGGPIGLVTAIPIGYLFSRLMTRKQIAIVASFAGALYAIGHLFVTHLWQSVALGILAGPFGVAIAIALAPLALQLLPRSGGLAERISLFVGPVAVIGLLASYISGLTYDHLVHDYRVIWAYAGAFGLIGTAVMFWLRVPPGQDHTDVLAMVREVRHIIVTRTGGTRRLFHGEVTAHDTDSVALLEEIQRALNPYEPASDADS